MQALKCQPQSLIQGEVTVRGNGRNSAPSRLSVEAAWARVRTHILAEVRPTKVIYTAQRCGNKVGYTLRKYTCIKTRTCNAGAKWMTVHLFIFIMYLASLHIDNR